MGPVRLTPPILGGTIRGVKQYRTTNPEDHTVGAYDELIGLLQALKTAAEEPRDRMDVIAKANPLLPGVHMAKGKGQELLGQIPLPMDHPKWQEIAGAMMAAMGATDAVIEYEQEIKQKAIDAVASWQQLQVEIDAVIRSFSQ